MTIKVILLENINSLGNKGEIKSVSDGYATNFLIPQGKALLATPENIKKLESKTQQLIKKQQAQNASYDKIYKSLNKQTLIFVGKVSDNDNLFSGISSKEIINEVKNKFNLDINDHWFARPVSFKKVGKHQVELKLPSGQQIIFYITINAK